MKYTADFHAARTAANAARGFEQQPWTDDELARAGAVARVIHGLCKVHDVWIGADYHGLCLSIGNHVIYTGVDFDDDDPTLDLTPQPRWVTR